MEKENSEEHKCVFSNGVKILVSDKIKITWLLKTLPPVTKVNLYLDR